MKSNIVIPCIEPARCFLTASSLYKRLSALPSGEVLLADKRKDLEEWRMLPQGDGIVMQSVQHGFFLQATSDGEMVTTTHTAEDASVFLLKYASGKRLTIQLQLSNSLGMFLVVEENGRIASRKAEAESVSTLWELEFLSGELCFMSNHAFNRLLKCNPFGGLSMTNVWGGWEVWRFIEIGAGRLIITSWTHDSKVLASDPDGKVHTTENKLGTWEEWTVERSDSGVLIQSVAHPGRYLCFNDNNNLFTTPDRNQKGIEWCLETANSHLFYMNCPSHDKRLSSNGDGVVFSNSYRKDCEQWTVKREEERWFSICSKRFGMYLASSNNGKVFTKASFDNDACWDIEELESGGLALLSHAFHRHLVLGDDCNLCTKLDDDGGVAWNLEPCMPQSRTGKQMATLVGASVAGLATVVAAPFAVTGVVGALGFGAGGIASGSIAAGMMSAEAVAAGGGVVAGGTVATLQSIGAVGLGFAGTTAALGGGAVVGSTIVGSTIAGIDCEPEPDVDSCSIMMPTTNRPLSNWRSW